MGFLTLPRTHHSEGHRRTRLGIEKYCEGGRKGGFPGQLNRPRFGLVLVVVQVRGGWGPSLATV